MLKEICDQEEKFRQNALETQRLQDTVGAPLVDTYTDFVAEEKRQVYVDADGKSFCAVCGETVMQKKIGHHFKQHQQSGDPHSLYSA